MTPFGRARESPNTRESTRVRPEIQALRALAVTLVVIYHLLPDRLPGGYVGVDVFFAISGFLITSHLFSQIQKTGTIALGKFYSRRIRRLLPASMLVLLVIGIVTLLVIPVRLWTTIGQNLLASALYAENWSLVANAVDYLGASSTSIPTQHFWSLAVEEQFYLVLPLVLIIAAFLFARRNPARRSVAIVATISVIGLASLVYSIWATNYDQASAYFNTFTRFWEFALGGIAAVVLPKLKLPPVVAVLLSWVGLLAILVVSFTYRDSSPFPGWIAAVPVLATLFVIAGGNHRIRLSTSYLFSPRPVQFIGDISYSIYLWHWPLIVLLPLALVTPLSTPLRIVIVVASLVLATLSKRFVEDPLRADRMRHESAPPPRFAVSRVFAAAVVAMLVVSGTGFTVLSIGQSRVDAARASLAALPAASTLSCFGATALPAFGCSNSNGLGTTVYPPPIIAREETGSQGCQQNTLDTDLLSCSFGSKSASAPRVALSGDSHAGEWLEGLKGVAVTEGWHLDTYLRSGCGLSLTSAPLSGDSARCEQWNQKVVQKLIDDRYDVVVVSTRSSLVGGGTMSTAQRETVAAGMGRAWSRLLDAGIRVVAIRDSPEPLADGVPDVPACVADAGALSAALAKCSVTRSKSLITDPQVEAVAATKGAQLVDMTRYFCPQATCPPVIGNVLVYSDGHHMTGLYSGSLAPDLGRALVTALARSGFPAS